MLKSIKLINFKRYENIDVDLDHKVTVLVGPNSSGKSSIIKSLLAFKQTYDDQNEHSGFLSRGEFVDIGPFSEYIRNHDTTKVCHFIFEIKLLPIAGTRLAAFQTNKAWIEIVHGDDPSTGHGRTILYSISLDGPIHDIKNYDPINDENRTIMYKRMTGSDDRYKINISKGLFDYAQGFSKKGGITYDRLCNYLSHGVVQAKRFANIGFFSYNAGTRTVPDDYNIFINFVERYTNELDRSLGSDLTGQLFALAALRDPPQRTSPRTDERLKVGARGQNVASVFYNFRQRALKKSNSKTRDDYNRLLTWLKDIDLCNDVTTDRWSDLIDFRAVINSESLQGESITDIGVGFSQAFPILVQLAVMPEGARLIVEQPELHLYPWAQSEFGRTLCAEAKRGRKNIIIETHSEHIIRGIQTHVSRSRVHGGATICYIAILK